MHQNFQKGEFEVSTDPARLDVGAIHQFLAFESYWAQGMERAVLERALAHSLNFGLYAGPRQIGLARVVTDYATFAYLCDVYVHADYRGHGLGQWLMSCVVAHPDLQTLRRFGLVTRDAHGLYAKFGWTALARPERHMERLPKNYYKTVG
jgi:GNAT superfamily N-acetyltransferase